MRNHALCARVTKSGLNNVASPTVQKVGAEPHRPLQVYAYDYIINQL